MLCYLILHRIPLKNNGKWYNSHMAEKIFHSIGGSRGKADHPGQGQKPVSRISVRTLVEFLLRSGDLDSRAQRGMDVEAALAGGRIHRKLQKAEKGDYAAEVMLSRDTEFEDLVIRVEGRADGIIGYRGLQEAGKTAEITDEQAEMKGLSKNVLDYLKKPVGMRVLLMRVQHYLNLTAARTDTGALDREMLSSLPESLTEREQDVARLMAQFRSDREISEMLNISMPYTKKLVGIVKEKLGLEKRGDIRRFLRK